MNLFYSYSVYDPFWWDSSLKKIKMKNEHLVSFIHQLTHPLNNNNNKKLLYQLWQHSFGWCTKKILNHSFSNFVMLVRLPWMKNIKASILLFLQALLNLGSNDPCLRSAAYNLLCALTATFNLKMEGQLLETSGLCIPANNTIFIVSISKTLADNEPHLTLEVCSQSHKCQKRKIKGKKRWQKKKKKIKEKEKKKKKRKGKNQEWKTKENKRIKEKKRKRSLCQNT